MVSFETVEMVTFVNLDTAPPETLWGLRGERTKGKCTTSMADGSQRQSGSIHLLGRGADGFGRLSFLTSREIYLARVPV